MIKLQGETTIDSIFLQFSRKSFNSWSFKRYLGANQKQKIEKKKKKKKKKKIFYPNLS